MQMMMTGKYNDECIFLCVAFLSFSYNTCMYHLSFHHLISHLICMAWHGMAHSDWRSIDGSVEDPAASPRKFSTNTHTTRT